MTTVKASCPSCATEVQLQPAQLECVEIVGGSGWYSFTCTPCDRRVFKPADAHVVTLLRSGDVRVITTTIPPEARESRPGPPLTGNDAADFAIDVARWDGRLPQDLR
jgi:hypothetical protein